MIKSKKNLYITIILIGMFSVVAAEIRLDNIDSIKNWNIIQKKVIQIKWTDYEGYPICQTTSILPFSIVIMVLGNHFIIIELCPLP